MKQLEVEWPQVFDKKRWQGAIPPSLYYIQAIPTLVVLDREKIRYATLEAAIQSCYLNCYDILSEFQRYAIIPVIMGEFGINLKGSPRYLTVC